MSGMDAIELLTVDDDGHAVKGPLYPADRGAAIVWLSDSDEQRLAYRHMFFRYGEHGQAMPETAVQFYVRDYMLDKGFPDRSALRAVEERMGWTADVT
jgi:hypothetical protein